MKPDDRKVNPLQLRLLRVLAALPQGVRKTTLTREVDHARLRDLLDRDVPLVSVYYSSLGEVDEKAHWTITDAGREVADHDPDRIVVMAGAARETETGVEGGIDVAFTLTIDGTEIAGEVTLRKDSQHWGAWGTPDHWVDGRTLRAIRDLPHFKYRDVLNAIEAATSPVAMTFEKAKVAS